MTKQNAKKRELSLGDDFGPATVHVNGASIRVDENSNVVVLTRGNIDAHTTEGSITAYADQVQLKKPVPEQVNAIDSLAKKEPETGDKMEDGTIYAGVSPDTGEALYVTTQDAPGTLKWKAAMQYAADLLEVNGHSDWRLPTKAELNVLYENRNKGSLKGMFNETGSGPAGWYWSSTKPSTFRGNAYIQKFSDGLSIWASRDYDASVRAVRSEPTRP